MIAQVVQDLQNVGEVFVIISIAWGAFVILFMISVWGHVAALRRKWAPTVEPILWEKTGAKYGVGVPLLQPMYGIWERRDQKFPVAVFPFTTDGKLDAFARLQELDAQPQS
jgi:hypothetical protein